MPLVSLPRHIWDIVDGRKARSYLAVYDQNVSFFNKRGLGKATALHELYRHVSDCYKLNQSRTEEERMARYYARYVLRKARASFA
jgi:hypothetical protein